MGHFANVTPTFWIEDDPDPIQTTYNIVANMAEHVQSGQASPEDLEEISDFVHSVADILGTDLTAGRSEFLYSYLTGQL